MGEGTPPRRFDREFKKGAVRLMIENGRTLASIALDLGITENMLSS